MKQFFITGLALMLSGSAALAQYADDPYSNSGSNNNNRSARYEQDQRYRQDNYNNDSYNDEYGDGYIDYDDDSYTTRFRRFNDVYAGYNYWSPVYSPYWAMPVYMDPWYYSPYRMGWGVSIGWSWGNPYWNSGWGMCNWWGYNGFNYWSRPYMGWGSGFSYAGWGNGGYGWGYGGYGYGWGSRGDYGYGGRGVINGPRRSYNSTIGGARGISGVRPNPGTSGSGRDTYRRRDAGLNNSNGTSRSVRGVEQGPRSGYTRDRVNNGNGIRVNEGSRRTRQIDNNFDRNVQPRRQERNYQSERPNVVAPRESTRPMRNYERSEPAPSRSYSPAPSRTFDGGGGGSRGGGFGGGSGGGGSRGGGGYRR